MVFCKCHTTEQVITVLCLHFVSHMERVFLTMLSANIMIQSLPIENGFTFKFNPISSKEDKKPVLIGPVMSKINGLRPTDERPDIHTKSNIPYKAEQGGGFWNQPGKWLFYPSKNMYWYNKSTTTRRLSYNMSQCQAGKNKDDLPLIKLPYNNYKILVATAPKNLLNSDTKGRVLIYVVFPEDGSNYVNSLPTVYFVNDSNNILKTESLDPMLIVNNNRTVTSLRSNAIAKFLRFKNKLLDRYNYKLKP